MKVGNVFDAEWKHYMRLSEEQSVCFTNNEKSYVNWSDSLDVFYLHVLNTSSFGILAKHWFSWWRTWSESVPHAFVRRTECVPYKQWKTLSNFVWYMQFKWLKDISTLDSPASTQDISTMNSSALRAKGTFQPQTFPPRIFKPWTFQTVNFSTPDISTSEFSTLDLSTPDFSIMIFSTNFRSTYL